MARDVQKEEEYNYVRQDCCLDILDNIFFCGCFGSNEDIIGANKAAKVTRAQNAVDKYVAKYDLDIDRCVYGDVKNDAELFQWMNEHDRKDAEAIVLINETPMVDKSGKKKHEVEICTQGFERIAQFLATNPDLKVLHIVGHPLNPQTAPALARGLRNHPSMTHVDVHDNDITEEDAHFLLGELVTCPKLQRVNFGDNPIPAAARDRIEEALNVNHSHVKVLW